MWSFGARTKYPDTYYATILEYNHPEVDLIWGIYSQYVLVPSKIILDLLQDGCKSKDFVVCGFRALRLNLVAQSARS